MVVRSTASAAARRVPPLVSHSIAVTLHTHGSGGPAWLRALARASSPTGEGWEGGLAHEDTREEQVAGQEAEDKEEGAGPGVEAVGAADFSLGPTSAAAPTASRRDPMRSVGAGVPDFVFASGYARTSAPPPALGGSMEKVGWDVGASDRALLSGFAKAPTPMPRGWGKRRKILGEERMRSG